MYRNCTEYVQNMYRNTGVEGETNSSNGDRIGEDLLNGFIKKIISVT